MIDELEDLLPYLNKNMKNFKNEEDIDKLFKVADLQAS